MALLKIKDFDPDLALLVAKTSRDVMSIRKERRKRLAQLTIFLLSILASSGTTIALGVGTIGKKVLLPVGRSP